MGFLARILAWFKGLFGKKLPKPVQVSIPGPDPVDAVLKQAERERIAYARYCKFMLKAGMTPARQSVWLKNRKKRPTGNDGSTDIGFFVHAKHNGTFSPVKSLKGRTDVSTGGDVHRARTAGRIKTRAERRKLEVRKAA